MAQYRAEQVFPSLNVDRFLSQSVGLDIEW